MPEGNPLVSIVIPAHNAERFLAETLASIERQTEPRWEVIVVDDGSVDATAAVAGSFAERDHRFSLVRQDSAGASAARNRGFRASDPGSRYVTFMDSDDVWMPGALATLLARVQGSPGAIGSHGLADFIDEDGQIDASGEHSARGRRRLGRRGRRLVLLGADEPTDFEVLINGNVMFPPGLMLARRDAYERAGPFDLSFQGAEDWDMLIRLSRLGPLAFLDEVILGYRRHDHNLGAQPTTPEQAWLVRCKAFHSPANSAAQRRSARLGWRAYNRMMLAEGWEQARIGVRRREAACAVHGLLRIGAAVWRYLRGYPTPRIPSEPLHW